MGEFKFENKNIIILSPEKWGKNHISKHHYAKELAKNNKVWFVESCGEKNLKESIVILNSEIQNLTTIKYKQTIKGRRFLPNIFVSFLEKNIVKRILKKIDVEIDVVWSFDQFRFLNLKLFNAKIKIFHPVDITNSPSSQKSMIANSADIIFHVSDYIVEDIITKKPIHFIQHGLSEDFINPAIIDKPNYILENKINVGYVGNLLNHYIDWDVLLKTVEQNTDSNFIFIGPYQNSNLGSSSIYSKNISILKGKKNTHLLGELPSKEIAGLLNHFDLLWLCYDNNKYKKQASNSHKIIEYLSSGKPVISSKINIIKFMKNIVIYPNDKHDFLEKFKDVISNINYYNSLQITEERISFALANTYKNNLMKIERLINSECIK